MAPSLSGLKVTATLADPPAAIVGETEAAENSVASDPLVVNGGVSVTGKPLLFVTTTNCGFEPVVPTMPKSTLVAVRFATPVIVTEKGALAAQPIASVATTLKLKVPAAFGVPDSVPSAASVNPGGTNLSFKDENANGGVPPDAVKIVQYQACWWNRLAARRSR